MQLKTIIKTLSPAITFIIAANSMSNAQTKSNDRFVGVHFDFNARISDSGIGKNFSVATVDSLLEMAKPDYIQVDSKGNFGYSSYPTTTGNAAKGIQKDILKLFRESTKKHKVDLYVHYSSLIDNYAGKQHAEWANIKSNGSKDWILSYASAYPQMVMIPQIKELASKYNLNGVWIDGDSYAVNLNYSLGFQQKFKAAYGIDVPKNKTDATFSAWIDFNRKQYMAYFRNYVNEIHRVVPGFKIINNYAYTSYMPEQPSVNVNFLSADIRGRDPYQAAFEGRCMAAQNKLWDIMSWSMMQMGKEVVTKSFQQLAQEAANTLALGGGFEMYFFQRKDGSLPTEHFKLMSDIISFCKQRKAYCYKGEIIRQTGLLYSYDSWKDSLTNESLYNSTGTNGLREMMKIVMDNQQSADVLMQYQLKEKLASYPVVIVPEWNNLGKNVMRQLLSYVNNGGNIIVEGADAVKPFVAYCSVAVLDKVNDSCLLKYNAASSSGTITFQKALVNNRNIEQLGTAVFQQDKTQYPLATISAYGKGKIALLYFNAAGLYSRLNMQTIKQLVDDINSKLLAKPVVTISGTADIQQMVTVRNNHLFVHLINMSGKSSSYNTVTPVQSFKVEIHTNKKPSFVLLQPGDIKLNYAYNNGVITATIPGVDIYSIIDVQ